jgi:Ferritin-like domain
MDVTRLRRLLREVDEEHRDTLRTVADDMAAVADAASRRSFLRGSLVVGGAAALVAGPLATGAAATGTTTTAPPKRPQEGDFALLGWAQSLELAAVAVYDAALASGRLSAVATTVATMFARHHSDHADAIGGLAGKSALGIANPALVAEFGPKVTAASSEAAVLTIAYDLENAAAATYGLALGVLLGTNAAALVASIQPIESRHAVVLGDVLGKSLNALVPEFQASTTGGGAIDPSKYPLEG